MARPPGRARRPRLRARAFRCWSSACRVPTATATAVYGAAYGFLPIGWIILNAVFLYNLTVATGQFDIVKASVGRVSTRSANPGAARRVFLRRVHRGRVRFRHAGRDLLGAADRSRLHTALCCRPVAHREHGAGRVRRDRHADPDARGRHRYPRAHDWHDGGPSAAVRLADRSRVAGGDDERVARACEASGRPSWCAAARSRSCSSPGATSSASSSSTSSAAWRRSPRSRCSCASGSRREVWEFPDAAIRRRSAARRARGALAAPR